MTTLALPQPKSLLRLSDLALLGVAVVWGTSYGVAKGALVFYPVLGFLAVRFILTFVLLLPALWRTNGQQRRDALRTGLPLGALMLGIFLCETFGIAHTQASKLTRHSSAPALALTAMQAAVIGFVSLLLALCLPGDLPPLPQSGAFWQASVYLVLGCTVFAFFAQNWALKHTSPSRVALLTSSEPAFGALFAVLWLGESLSITGWIGGGLIVLAALWTTVHAGPRPTGHDDAGLAKI
ncbi:MAG TPA: DMT family transporter [Rhodoferax sp.]